jgi:hypothetical protein
MPVLFIIHCKNTTAIDMLLLKCEVTWSYFEVLCCDELRNQNGLHPPAIVSSCHAPIWVACLLLSVTELLTWSALFDEKSGLSFAVPAGPRHRSYCQGYVLTSPRNRVDQLCSGFHFYRLLPLAEVQWRYSNPQRGGEVEVEVTSRLTISQSVCLGIEYPCGTCDQILFPVGMLHECRHYIVYPQHGLHRNTVSNKAFVA